MFMTAFFVPLYYVEKSFNTFGYVECFWILINRKNCFIFIQTKYIQVAAVNY